jgi:hypothetical protein
LNVFKTASLTRSMVGNSILKVVFQRKAKERITMKIYVAARFHEKERVKKIYAQLIELGHEITEDWTVCQTMKPYSMYPNNARQCAEHTIEAVKDAEIFIFLTNEEIGAGSSVELGAALLSHVTTGFPKICVVGPHRENIYCFYHPAVQFFDTVEEVMQAIKQGIAQ